MRLPILVLILTLLGGGLSRADGRKDIPPAEDLTKAEKLIRDLFKADYAKTKPADRSALAAKLLQQAAETEEPAAKYVLLRDSRTISSKVGDAVTALAAAEELANVFKVNPAEARVAIAAPLLAAATTPTSAKNIADSLMAAAEASWGTDDWNSVIELLKATVTLARKGQNVPLASGAGAKLKIAETIKAEAEAVKEHIETLAAKPDDPAANAAVGRYLALVKFEWELGLIHLEKGSDAKLKEMAAQDLKAATAAEQLAAADAWYDLAATAEPAVKAGMQIRAHIKYTLAAAELTGLDKTKAEKRIAELAPLVDSRGDRKAKFWTGIRKALAAQEVKKWDTVGGAFSKKTFEEMPIRPGILIGFNYTTLAKGEYPGAVQPIYLTATGELLGPVMGIPEKGAKMETTKAKPGYAVGALYTRGGGGFDCIKPIYMKITDTGLDPKDQYDGPKIGGDGGEAGTFGGDGNLIVGLHGKLGGTSNVGALSIITLTTVKLKDK